MRRWVILVLLLVAAGVPWIFVVRNRARLAELDRTELADGTSALPPGVTEPETIPLVRFPVKVLKPDAPYEPSPRDDAEDPEAGARTVLVTTEQGDALEDAEVWFAGSDGPLSARSAADGRAGLPPGEGGLDLLVLAPGFRARAVTGWSGDAVALAPAKRTPVTVRVTDGDLAGRTPMLALRGIGTDAAPFATALLHARPMEPASAAPAGDVLRFEVAIPGSYEVLLLDRTPEATGRTVVRLEIPGDGEPVEVSVSLTGGR